MRCKGVQRGGDCGWRSLPRDLLPLWKQVNGSSRQSRHVQDLANRANAVGSARVLVDKDAAKGEIQQSDAA
jgi:hypothetical protein